MLVNNNVTSDSRVRKSALAAAAMGADVTVVGVELDGFRTESEFGPVRIIRVPVDSVLRDQTNERRRSRRRRLSLGQHERRVTKSAWRRWDKAISRSATFARYANVVAEVDDFERAFAPVIDELHPDLIHAHDVQLIGVAEHAARRLSAEGARVPWIYDAHEWVPHLSQYGKRTARVIAGWADLERTYAPFADRIITVSPALADEIGKTYDLKQPPAVVLNAPSRTQHLVSGPKIRELLALHSDIPLLVYSGGVQAARGVLTAVEALQYLPDVHLAIVAVPNIKIRGVTDAIELATKLAVQDRLHLLDPVPSDDVSSFLSTASLGLLPLMHFGSHEVALANKLFEYLHAGIPVVVSDCRAQAQFVREYKVGAIHRAGNPQDFARAVREALSTRADSIAHIESSHLVDAYCWERQEGVLAGVYRDLLGSERFTEPARSLDARFTERRSYPRRVLDPAQFCLGIGPTNSAGQARLWGTAVTRRIENLECEVIAIGNDRIDFPADTVISRNDYLHDRAWSRRTTEHALANWSHALIESGRAIFGPTRGRDFAGDARVLDEFGVAVGLVFHGSEVRDPRRHAASEPWSPFGDPRDELTARLQAQCDRLLPVVNSWAGTKLVSTPDLIEFVPGSRWLPVVVDARTWSNSAPILKAERPVVLHVPSRSALKGTDHIDPILSELHGDGLIDYRREQDVRPADMPALVANSDIIIDQFALGSYGVFACEGMAASRVVVGHVSPAVRAHAVGLPILEATPNTLRHVLTGCLEDRSAAQETAIRGPEFIAAFHDGRRSAEILADFIRGTENALG